MQTKINFWGESIDVPLNHTYSVSEELAEARSALKRWSEEWREKKTAEMEIFNGKTAININEGESSVSGVSQQSKKSNQAEKGQKIAEAAQIQFAGVENKKKVDGRGVQFEEPSSPGLDRKQMREAGGSDGKEEIRTLDQYLAGAGEEFGIGLEKTMSLEELSKRKSRVMRDEEELNEELEE